MASEVSFGITDITLVGLTAPPSSNCVAIRSCIHVENNIQKRPVLPYQLSTACGKNHIGIWRLILPPTWEEFTPQILAHVACPVAHVRQNCLLLSFCPLEFCINYHGGILEYSKIVKCVPAKHGQSHHWNTLAFKRQNMSPLASAYWDRGLRTAYGTVKNHVLQHVDWLMILHVNAEEHVSPCHAWLEYRTKSLAEFGLPDSEKVLTNLC